MDPRFVDYREEKGGRLLPLQMAGFQRKLLHSGDAQFPVYGDKVALVENKLVYQVLGDMASGQLMKQMRIMKESCDYPILLVEGRWAHKGSPGYQLLDHPNYTWEQAWNELHRIQQMGIYYEPTTSLEHTCARIIQLAELYSKPAPESAVRGIPGDPRLIGLKVGIHGIGDKLGAELLKDRTLANIATMSPEQLQDIPGVGPKLARRIWEYFNLAGAPVPVPARMTESIRISTPEADHTPGSVEVTHTFINGFEVKDKTTIEQYKDELFGKEVK